MDTHKHQWTHGKIGKTQKKTGNIFKNWKKVKNWEKLGWTPRGTHAHIEKWENTRKHGENFEKMGKIVKNYEKRGWTPRGPCWQGDNTGTNMKNQEKRGFP